MLNVRRAVLADAEFLYRLRVDSESQRMFFGPPPKSLMDHKNWLAAQLQREDFFLVILESGGNPLAYFRVDAAGDTSVAVAPEQRGKGLGSAAIRSGLGEHLVQGRFTGPYHALIFRENAASIRAFETAGFRIVAEETKDGKKIVRLEYKPSLHLLCASKGWKPAEVEDLTRASLARFHVVREKAELTTDLIYRLKPEQAFFPHWSHILPASIYDAVPCVMFHMTDLPFGRGGSPLQNLILRKHTATQISCFLCDGGLDTGPIYFKKPLSLEGSAREILARASSVITQMIAEFLISPPKPVPQTGEAVLFSRRKPEDGNLAPVSDVEAIYDYIRMLDAEGYPPAFLEKDGNIFEFFDAILSGGVLEAKVRIRKL